MKNLDETAWKARGCRKYTSELSQNSRARLWRSIAFTLQICFEKPEIYRRKWRDNVWWSLQVDWHWNKMLPIHIESLSFVLQLNWIRINQDTNIVVSPGICLVIWPLPYWNRRTSRLLLFGSSVGFYKVLDKHGRIVLHFPFVSFVLSLWIEQWAMFMKITWINQTQYLKTWTLDIFETTWSLIMHAKVGPNKAPGSAFSKRPPTKRSTSDTFLMKVMISRQPQ